MTIERAEIVGQRLVAVYESQTPESVGESIGAEWLYFGWYIRLENDLFFQLEESRLIRLRSLPEPMKPAQVVATRWIPGVEYFRTFTFASDEFREQCIRECRSVRDIQVLESDATERLLKGKVITEVIRGAAGNTDEALVVLVLDGCGHLSTRSAEGGNVFQYDELDEQLDVNEHERWSRHYDEAPCDVFGRPFPDPFSAS